MSTILCHKKGSKFTPFNYFFYPKMPLPIQSCSQPQSQPTQPNILDIILSNQYTQPKTGTPHAIVMIKARIGSIINNQNELFIIHFPLFLLIYNYQYNNLHHLSKNIYHKMNLNLPILYLSNYW